MPVVGRNDPCPCGSGKKSKKCCLDRLQAEALAERQRQHAEQRVRTETLMRALSEAFVQQALTSALPAADDHLDELSNSVVDLVRERRFDEALLACDRLLRDFPDAPDGLERSALVHETMGNRALALDFYQRALELTLRPDLRDGYDDEGRDFYREKIAKLSDPSITNVTSQS